MILTNDQRTVLIDAMNNYVEHCLDCANKCHNMGLKDLEGLWIAKSEQTGTLKVKLLDADLLGRNAARYLEVTGKRSK